MFKKLGLLSLLTVVSATGHALTLNYQSFVSGQTGSVLLDNTQRNVQIGKQSFIGSIGTITAVSANVDASPSVTAPYAELMTPGNTTKLGLAGRIVAKNFQLAGLDPTKSAGLQLAVWEALYDGGTTFSATNGRFRLSDPSLTGAISYAQSIYDAAWNQPGQARYYLNSALRGQSQIAPVPEPASMLALACGVAGFLRSRRKKSA